MNDVEFGRNLGENGSKNGKSTLAIWDTNTFILRQHINPSSGMSFCDATNGKTGKSFNTIFALSRGSSNDEVTINKYDIFSVQLKKKILAGHCSTTGN